LAPVCDIRASICTSFARRPGRPYRLRHGRVPRSQKIRAEADGVVSASQIERGQRSVAKAQQIRLPQHGFIKRLIPDRGWRSVDFQELAYQLDSLTA
jgi:hypothetical protein